MNPHLDAMAQERVKLLQFMAKVEQRQAQREAEAEERHPYPNDSGN